MYDFGRTWSFEEYASKPKSRRDIRRDMHKQREWRNELERMKISNVVGCLYVDSKSLRNDLLPITLTTLDKIKLLLLNMSRETCLQVWGGGGVVDTACQMEQGGERELCPAGAACPVCSIQRCYILLSL